MECLLTARFYSGSHKQNTRTANSAVGRRMKIYQDGMGKVQGTFMKRQLPLPDKRVCPEATPTFSKGAFCERFPYHPFFSFPPSRLKQAAPGILFLTFIKMCSQSILRYRCMIFYRNMATHGKSREATCCACFPSLIIAMLRSNMARFLNMKHGNRNI